MEEITNRMGTERVRLCALSDNRTKKLRERYENTCTQCKLSHQQHTRLRHDGPARAHWKFFEGFFSAVQNMRRGGRGGGLSLTQRPVPVHEKGNFGTALASALMMCSPTVNNRRNQPVDLQPLELQKKGLSQ